jgi:hypothetical protein
MRKFEHSSKTVLQDNGNVVPEIVSGVISTACPYSELQFKLPFSLTWTTCKSFLAHLVGVKQKS